MSFANPLNYSCAPNAASPHHAPAPFDQFLAHGLWFTWDFLLGDEPLPGATEDDVRWLRRQFLDELENAIQAAPDMIRKCYEDDKPSEWFQEDHAPGGVSVGASDFRWLFLRAEPHVPSLLFSLDWGEDDYACWLDWGDFAVFGAPPAVAFAQIEAARKVIEKV